MQKILGVRLRIKPILEMSKKTELFSSLVILFLPVFSFTFSLFPICLDERNHRSKIFRPKTESEKVAKARTKAKTSNLWNHTKCNLKYLRSHPMGTSLQRKINCSSCKLNINEKLCEASRGNEIIKTKSKSKK